MLVDCIEASLVVGARIPPTGSGSIVQVLHGRPSRMLVILFPRTARKNKKQRGQGLVGCRLYLNDPPTAVGGIRALSGDVFDTVH